MKRSQRFWRTAGIALATVMGIFGLAVIAFVVYLAVALNSWGSNK